jgi:hypothetical protein
VPSKAESTIREQVSRGCCYTTIILSPAVAAVDLELLRRRVKDNVKGESQEGQELQRCSAKVRLWCSGNCRDRLLGRVWIFDDDRTFDRRH